MLRSLDSNNVFVLTFATFKDKPVNFLISLVFIAFDEIPSENEVLCNVVNAIPYNAHSDIVPRHSTEICFAKFVLTPVIDSLEIHDSIVVKILTGEDFILNTGWVDIR